MAEADLEVAKPGVAAEDHEGQGPFGGRHEELDALHPYGADPPNGISSDNVAVEARITLPSTSTSREGGRGGTDNRRASSGGMKEKSEPESNSADVRRRASWNRPQG